MKTEPTTARGRATLERILRSASELIVRDGIAAVRLEDVETAAGVGRSQIYHYFADRDDLIRSVVGATIDTVLAAQEPALENLDSMEGIDRWFETIIANGTRPQAVADCAIGLLAAQLGGQDDIAQKAFIDAFDRWEAPLIAGLTQMRERGDLLDDVDVVELADMTMAAIQGGLLLAQVRRSPDQLTLALRAARSALHAASPASACKPS